MELGPHFIKQSQDAPYKIERNIHAWTKEYNVLFVDQPVGTDKNMQIKFNEKIAGKFKSGLSLHYLNEYLGNDILKNYINLFYIFERVGLIE